MHFETSGRQPQTSKSESLPPVKREGFEVLHDTQTGMLLGIPRSARCVQRFDDSLNSAIHITFRTFAAFFIDAKAKRSVVESCYFDFTPWGFKHASIFGAIVKGGEAPFPNGQKALADRCTGVSGCVTKERRARAQQPSPAYVSL